MAVYDKDCGCRIYTGAERRKFKINRLCSYHTGVADALDRAARHLRQRLDAPDYVHEHNVMLADEIEKLEVG